MDVDLPELNISVNQIKGIESPRDLEKSDTISSIQQLLDTRQESSKMIQRDTQGIPPSREPASSKVRFVSNHDASAPSPTGPEPKHSPQIGKSILLSNNKARDTSSAHQSVFERLSRTDTVASIHRKVVSKEIVRKRSASAPPLRQRPTSASALILSRNPNNRSPKVKSHSKNLKKNSNAEAHDQKMYNILSKPSFEHLAGKHTKLSMIRKQKSRKNNLQQSRVRRVRSTSRGRPAALERWKSAPIIQSNEQDEEIGDQTTESVVSAGPPLEIGFTSRMEVFTTNTDRPEDGFDQIDCSGFGLGLNGCLAEYEAGGLSAKEVASEIVNSMFMRDLPDQQDWSVKEPLHRELALPLGEKGFSFFIESCGEEGDNENNDGDDKNNDGDNDDGEASKYSASATGNVIFIHDLYEIHVEDYSFVCEV